MREAPKIVYFCPLNLCNKTISKHLAALCLSPCGIQLNPEYQKKMIPLLDIKRLTRKSTTDIAYYIPRSKPKV